MINAELYTGPSVSDREHLVYIYELVVVWLPGSTGKIGFLLSKVTLLRTLTLRGAKNPWMGRLGLGRGIVGSWMILKSSRKSGCPDRLRNVLTLSYRTRSLSSFQARQARGTFGRWLLGGTARRCQPVVKVSTSHSVIIMRSLRRKACLRQREPARRR